MDTESVGRAPVEEFNRVLAEWHEKLKTQLAAIRTLLREVGGVGPAALGRRWAEAVARIDSAAAILGGETIAVVVAPTAATPTAAAPTAAAPTAAGLMSAGEGLERAATALDAAAVTVMDPAAQSSAITGMSRTYSENLKSFGRRALETGAAAHAARLHARHAAAGTGAIAARGSDGAPMTRAGLDSLIGAYGEQKGGELATEIYISALLHVVATASADVVAAARRSLEDSKNFVFGLPLDDPAAAAADTAELAEYHPLQAMAYAPAALGAHTPGAHTAMPPALPEGCVNLQFPQARLVVTYDIDPLIDRRRSLDFGPLATVTTGLNYRLVERLRTIRAEPRAAPATAASATSAATITGPLTVTIDGRSPRTFEPGHVSGLAWAPFAGAPPRVEAYAAASASVILAGIREDRAAGWDFDTRVQYEKAVRAAPPVNVSEALASELVSQFEAVYDAAPPESPRDFRDLVVPKEPAPGTYICRAIVRLGSASVETRVRELHMRTSAPRVPIAVLSRDAWTNQMIQIVDANVRLWKSISGAFRNEVEAFDLSGIQRKAALMRAFRGIATEAAKAVPVVAPSSLKFFGATLTLT